MYYTCSARAGSGGWRPGGEWACDVQDMPGRRCALVRCIVCSSPTITALPKLSLSPTERPSHGSFCRHCPQQIPDSPSHTHTVVTTLPSCPGCSRKLILFLSPSHTCICGHPPPIPLLAGAGGPVIAPCRCKGTQKYVHSECLDQWRAAKVSHSCRHRPGGG